jgi:hypothetical protein
MLKSIGKLFSKEPNSEALDAYLKWRDIVFSVTKTQVEVVTDQPDHVYGAIMDVGLSDDFTITITAFPTGEASLRTTIGGGVIGLGGDELISEHAKHIVSLAQSLFKSTHLTNNHNLPKANKIYFYFLTTSGLMRSESTVEETDAQAHPFHQMFGLFTEIKRRSEHLQDSYKK